MFKLQLHPPGGGVGGGDPGVCGGLSFGHPSFGSHPGGGGGGHVVPGGRVVGGTATYRCYDRVRKNKHIARTTVLKLKQRNYEPVESVLITIQWFADSSKSKTAACKLKNAT